MAVNKSYVRPHTEVYQFLDKAVESTGLHLTACIIGSQYDLYRVGKEEIEPTPVGEITGDTISVQYTYDKHPLYSYDVDADSFQVVCEEVLLDITGTNIALAGIVQTTDYAKVIFGTADSPQIISSPDVDDLPAAFGGYSIQIGDLLEIGSKLYTVKDLVLNDGSVDKYIGVVLDRTPVDISLETITTACTLSKILKSYSGAVDVSAVNVGTSTISIPKTITIELAGKASVKNIYPGHGNLYPEFRVRVIPPNDEDIITVGSIEDIQELLGTIAVQNEIAYAAWCAIRGSQGREVYVIRLRSTDVDGYIEALKKTDADPYPYSFVPILDGTGTHDSDIINTIVQYCNDKSQPEVQMWRTALIGIDREGEYEVKFTDGKAATAVFAPASEGETPVTLCQLLTEGCSFNSVNVNGAEGKMVPGDYIVYSDTKYQIKEVLADNLVRLVSGPVSRVDSGSITLRKAASARNYKDYLHGLSSTIADRRAVVVWCDHGTYNGDTIPCSYLAAEIAGILSAVLPQQSITMTEIQSLTSCARMYTRYTLKQLDEIAAGGILIITLDNKYGVPYIRHQLTTDSTNGSLYSEMSITKNLDNISYGVSDVIKGYCGKANVTTSALTHLKQAIIAKLTEYTSDSVDDLIGPSLVRFYGLEVKQDPKFMDQVIVNVTYELPLPMNNIKVYLMVYRATVLIDANN